MIKQPVTSRDEPLQHATVRPNRGLSAQNIDDSVGCLAEYEQELVFYQGLLALGVLPAFVFWVNFRTVLPQLFNESLQLKDRRSDDSVSFPLRGSALWSGRCRGAWKYRTSR